MRSRGWVKSKYYGLTAEEIQAQWALNGKQAAELGTKLHAMIECYYNHGNMADFSDMLATPEFAHFQRFVTDELFSKSWVGEVTIPYRTEWTVYDETANIGGTIDMVYKNVQDGTYTLVDWKRCKQIYKANRYHDNKKKNKIGRSGKGVMSEYPDCNFTKYSLQLQIYRYILENTYGMVVRDMKLVVIHPSKPNYEVHAIEMESDLYTKTVPEIFRALRRGTREDGDWATELRNLIDPPQPPPPSCHQRSDSWDTGHIQFLPDDEEEKESIGSSRTPTDSSACEVEG